MGERVNVTIIQVLYNFFYFFLSEKFQNIIYPSEEESFVYSVDKQ